MPRVSQGVQRFRAQADALVTEATTENRNVTKTEIAGALFEMVRTDKLSQADRSEAATFLQSGAPLTRGARALLGGFSDADQQSIADVMSLANQIASTAGGAATSSKPIYSSLDRLDAMFELFAERGNKKLDAGEVQAIAGFYAGLKPRSRAKIKDRVVEIYQQASYSQGQQAALRQLLERAGIARATLEGVDPSTPGGFSGMSDSARVDALMELWANWESEAVADVRSADLPAAVKAKLQTKVDAWIGSELADLAGEDDPAVWESSWRALHLVDDDSGDRTGGGPVAYAVEVDSTFGNGGNTQALFFDTAGEYLGSDYLSEE